MINKIFINYNRIKNAFSTVVSRLYCKILGIKLGQHVKFKGVPLLFKTNNATICIGSGTTINSNNFGYHLNMFTKSKLMADYKDAVIIIGDNCRIHGTCIHAVSSIVIGNNCLIAANTNIIDNSGHLLSFDNPSNRINTIDKGKPIVINDNVWIGANCMILGGITIGEGAVVAANSVVKDDVPPMCIVAGNPAKVIKNYS